MNPRIEPKLPLHMFGPYQYSQRISSSPYEIGKYAPHLHIQAYHENVRKVHVHLCTNEIIMLRIPRKFTFEDTVQFISENENEIYANLKKAFDNEYDGSVEPITRDCKVPFLGNDLPIRQSDESMQRNAWFDETTVYLKPNVPGEGVHEAILDIFGEIAYKILKPRLDRYAKLMGIKYSGLEIDDGRRTFGSFNTNTKEVFLSRRLLMMPESVIDFLIVHELAHAESLSHGDEHDAAMGKVLPDYQELDDAFNECCGQLLLRGWI